MALFLRIPADALRTLAGQKIRSAKITSISPMKNLILTAMILLSLSSCEQGKSSTNQKKETIVEEKALPFPMETGYTREYLMANFWKCTYDHLGDQLAYWVVLPKNVKPVKLEAMKVKGGEQQVIGQYSTVEGGPYLEAQVINERVKEELSPKDWLEKIMKQNGETVLQRHVVKAPNGIEYMDALTQREMPDGQRIISRFTVLNNGPAYFSLKLAAANQDYEKLALTMCHVSANWGLK